MLEILTVVSFMLAFELVPVISTEPSELLGLGGGLFWVGIVVVVFEGAFEFGFDLLAVLALFLPLAFFGIPCGMGKCYVNL